MSRSREDHLLFGACAAWLVLCLPSRAPAWEVPLPPPRPAEFAKPSVLPSILPTPPVGNDGPCAELLSAGSVEGDVQPPVAGQDGCGISSPILLRMILLTNGGKITVEPPALIGCALAGAVADWVRSDVALAAEGGQLARIEIAGAYECRGRNRVREAKLSEHGLGNALDIRAFSTSRGQRFDVARQSDARRFFQSLRQSACMRFMTVLGPGSDGFHESHLHVDLQPRSRSSHFCQWTIN